MRRFIVSVVCAVVLATFAASARAGDANPPGPNNPFAPWTRGDPFTTTSSFRFPTPGPAPEGWISNPTLPSSQILGGPGSVWLPGPPGTTYEGGVWCIENTATGPGFLDILIPNYHRPDPKIVYVQFKFFGGVPKFDVFDPSNPPPNGPTGVPWTTLTPTPSPVPGGPAGLAQISYSLCFPYNPQAEIVRIMSNGTAPTYIDQLVIDTLCTPAPGAGALLAIGVLAAARRRR